jgi:flagellin
MNREATNKEIKPMRIQNNIAALNAHRNYGINNTRIAKSVEKLSSGYRINRAGDDAAGLAISEKMRAQIRGLAMASKNAQDGVSLIQTAEGGLQSAHDILQRMRELAVQAGNDPNQTEDRDAIQNEIEQLTQELDRVAHTTSFNRRILLDGSLGDATLGPNKIEVTGVDRAHVTGAGLDKATMTATGSTASGITASTAIAITLAAAATATLTINTNDKTDFAAGSILTVGVNGQNYSVTLTGDADTDTATTNTAADLANAVNAKGEKLGDLFTFTANAGSIGIKANEAGLAGNSNAFKIVSIVDSVGGTVSLNVGTATSPFTSGANATSNQSYTSTDGYTFINTTTGGTFTIDQELAKNGGTFTLGVADKDDTSKYIDTSSDGAGLILQVGANSGKDQTIRVNVAGISAQQLGLSDNMTTTATGGVSGTSNLSVASNEQAQKALDAIDVALQSVSDQRGVLGAVQNRLEYAIGNLDTAAENLTAAESRIRDVDMAKEMTTFMKNNILGQASTAMLAQANSLPQSVLQLLG